MAGPVFRPTKLFRLFMAGGKEADLAFEFAGFVEFVDQLDGQVSLAAAHFQGHVMNAAGWGEQGGLEPGPGGLSRFLHCRERLLHGD